MVFKLEDFKRFLFDNLNIHWWSCFDQTCTCIYTIWGCFHTGLSFSGQLVFEMKQNWKIIQQNFSESECGCQFYKLDFVLQSNFFLSIVEVGYVHGSELVENLESYWQTDNCQILIR